MNKINIEEIKKKITPILKKHDVIRAAIFGSFVRGEITDNSDLDILVKFKGEKSLLDLVGLKIDLEDKIKRKADVVTYDSLDPILKKNILKEQVAII